MADARPILLRVAGLGHDCQIEVPDAWKVDQVKAVVSERTGIPPPYVLLLSRGKKLTDGAATLSALGVKNRTRLMLMHGPGWHADRAGVEEVQSICRSLDDLEARVPGIEAGVVDELVTRACIRLDAVEVGGSEALRELRRSALRRAEDLAARHGSGGVEGENVG